MPKKHHKPEEIARRRACIDHVRSVLRLSERRVSGCLDSIDAPSGALGGQTSGSRP
jgi:hypothetical protein